MIYIEKSDSNLVLVYYSELDSGDWLDEKLSRPLDFSMLKVFNLNRALLIKKEDEEFSIDPTLYFFKIGELVGEYFKMDSAVLGTNNEFYFHKSLPISETYFVVPTKNSLLRQIDKQVQQDVYIGGNKEDVLPHEEFLRLVKNFPSAHEISLYRKAKVSSILKQYFDNIPNREAQYNAYVNKRTKVYSSNLRKTFKDSEIIKYETLLEKLQSMLDNEVSYSEYQWQEEILQILLLLFPKYLAVFKEVRFRDIYSNKYRRLDYALIDFNGNLDVLEIKKPFDKKIVSNPISYRDNCLPNKDLSGAIMQIEKYIYYLNKLGTYGEKKLTAKYQNQLPNELSIKITNPNGLILWAEIII